ncbi:MAG: hypothetical protein J5775_04500 [Spirochaetales bacterium]|nr:hypothetical protein [Spirochaetales bacterium]
MNRIDAFIDSFCELYETRGFADEEEQVLPDREVLKDVFMTLLNASCLREEASFSSFRVCFLDPESSFLDAYVYAHRLKFDTPIPFSVSGLHKLAPAINPSMSYLVVNLSKAPYMVTGIIAAYTTWDKIMKGERLSGSGMPLVPNFFVKGPGEIDACFGEQVIVGYSFGSFLVSRYHVFESSLVADELRRGSSVSEEERVKFLCRVLWNVNHYKHGGAILIVPSKDYDSRYLDIKYKLPCEFLFRDEMSMIDVNEAVRNKELVSYSDFIAKLTTVDGAVLLTKDLDLLGFGVEILTDKMARKQPDMRFINSDDTENKNRKFNDNGTRHRSGYRFCDCVEGSVAIVCSQDGSVKACTKKDGKVVVYDNVAT